MCEIRRESWDKRPREKEPANFNLKENYTIPTNTSMYYCKHCTEDDIEHKIEDIGELYYYESKGIELLIKPQFWNQGTFRLCSGCGRKDGTWVQYGDD